MRRRLGCAAALALAWSSGLAATASAATTASSAVDDRFGYVDVYLSGDEADAEIAVRRDGPAFVVSDPRGMVAGTGCSQITARRVSCIAGPRDYDAALIAELGGGRDILETEDTFGSATLRGGSGNDVLSVDAERSYLAGGAGADRLAGSGGEDYIVGGTGRDELKGGGGDDRLDGGSGPDSIRGGRGSDKVKAADRTEDSRIGCGPGPDRAFIDAVDPRPGRGCERYSIVL